MEAVCSSDPLIPSYPTTRCHNLEGHKIYVSALISIQTHTPMDADAPLNLSRTHAHTRCHHSVRRRVLDFCFSLFDVLFSSSIDRTASVVVKFIRLG
jgi:hypothetical protein